MKVSNESIPITEIDQVKKPIFVLCYPSLCLKKKEYHFFYVCLFKIEEITKKNGFLKHTTRLHARLPFLLKSYPIRGSCSLFSDKYIMLANV